MKRRLLLIVIVLAIVTASVAAYYRANRTAAGPQVATAPVTRGDVVDSVDATGTLEAVTTVQVGTQVSGTIAWLGADFNSVVHKGQVIARLDPSLFQAQLEQARATLVRLQAEETRARVQVTDAQQKLARAKTLSEKNLIPAQDLETAQVTLESAQAALKSAQAQIVQARAALNQNQVNLDHTIIRAPIDGIVIQRSVDVGQTVAASMQAPTLFVLAQDLSQMQVKASIDESDIGRIRPGQRVRFRVDAYQGEEFTGSVTQVRLQPVVTQNVVSYQTVVAVPNRQLKLKPGMTANVTVEIARQNHVLRVPSTALRFRPTAQMFAALGQTPPEGIVGARPAADVSTTSPAPGGGTLAEGGAGAGDRRGGQGGQGASAGQGAFGGLGGGQGLSGEARAARRQAFRERMQQLSPEEREQMRQRMEQRRAGREAGDQTAPRPDEGAAPGRDWRSASTIDAMFGPIETPVRSARVWLYVNGQLKPVSVTVGISDATNAALVDGPLQDGASVVTGFTVPAASASSGNPLLPSFGRRPGAGAAAGPRGGR